VDVEFVSTHSFVPATSISYDLMLPAFAGTVCVRTSGHAMPAAPNASAANLIAVLDLAIFMAPPRVDFLAYLTQLRAPFDLTTIEVASQKNDLVPLFASGIQEPQVAILTAVRPDNQRTVQCPIQKSFALRSSHTAALTAGTLVQDSCE
jgi:hypothetical protein